MKQKITIFDLMITFENHENKSTVEIGDYPAYESYYSHVKISDDKRLCIFISERKNKINSLTSSIRKNLSALASTSIFILEGNSKCRQHADSISVQLASTNSKTVKNQTAWIEIESKKIHMSIFHTFEKEITMEELEIMYLATLAATFIDEQGNENNLELPNFISKLAQEHKNMIKSFQSLVN